MRIEIPENVIYKEIGDEGIALNIETGYYYLLNSVAARMFAVLFKTGSADEVLDAMLKEYDVSKEDLEEDFKRLLEDLKANGIVKEIL